MKLLMQDLVIDAELHRLSDGRTALLRVCGSFFCPSDVVCMGLRLRDANAEERTALRDAGFIFVATD